MENNIAIVDTTDIKHLINELRIINTSTIQKLSSEKGGLLLEIKNLSNKLNENSINVNKYKSTIQDLNLKILHDGERFIRTIDTLDNNIKRIDLFSSEMDEFENKLESKFKMIDNEFNSKAMMAKDNIEQIINAANEHLVIMQDNTNKEIKEKLEKKTDYINIKVQDINQNILTIKKEFEKIKKLMNKSLKIILISLTTIIFFATCFFIVDFLFLGKEEIIKPKPIAAIKKNIEKLNVESAQNQTATYDFSAKISQEEFKAQKFYIYTDNYEKLRINLKDFFRNDVINGFRFVRANSEGKILFVDQNSNPVWVIIE